MINNLAKRAVFFVWIWWLSVNVAAQVPQTLSYQGLLTDATGNPLSGSHTILFNFYNSATATATTFSRGPLTVTTFQGLFTVILGNGQGSNNTGLPNLGSVQYYIGIVPDGASELAPRVALTAVPYAFTASALDPNATLAGTQVGTGINASNITTGTLNGALVGAGINAANITGTLPGAQVGTGIIATNITTGTVANTLLDANLQDLADGSLTGSKVGTGISAANITTGTIANTLLDANLQDLADGSLTGSKIGTGISAANITTGSLNGSLVGGGVNAANVTTGKLALAQLPASLDLTTTASSLILTPGTTLTRPTPAALGAIRFNTDPTVNTIEYWNGTNWYFTLPKVAIVKEIKTFGVSGGPFLSGAWQTRVLNTIDGDGQIVTLSNNQFTLGPGEYIIEASAPGYNVSAHKIRLQNLTAATNTYSYGQSNYSSTTAGSTYSSLTCYVITTAATTSFEIQHICFATNNTDGFGYAYSLLSSPEVYTTVKITKVRAQ